MAFAGVYLTQIKQVFYNRISTSAENGSLYVDTLEVVAPQQETSAHKDIDSSSEQTQNSDEYTESNYPGILDTDLTSLTRGQKNFFIVTVTILCTISVFGNLSTLVVNSRRKIRPFFRACLISLAFSDLMNSVFLSTAYLSQFTEEYVQIWSLGPLMCNFVPFATTAAILASSMTLVGIAVDRYYAVMKAVVGFWQPTVISCTVCMLCIWLASIGIACPVFTIYDFQPVYILTEQHDTDASGGEALTPTAATTSTESRPVFTAKIANNTVTVAGTAAATAGTTTRTPWEMDVSQEDLSYTLIREQRLVDICISDQKDVTLYYVIVFVIIFIPCIGAFFWFNTIIARKLWNRRHSATITKRQQTKDISSKAKPKSEVTTAPSMELQSPPTTTPADPVISLQPQCQNCNCRSGHTSSTVMPSSLIGTVGGATTTGSSSANSAPSISASTHNSREARHLRMFTIILLMMAVFLFLRLPAWIFLLMRMYGSYTKPVDWILYFVFGIMNLASSVLNPLFYTFLTETIQYFLSCKAKVTAVLCGACTLFECCRRHNKGKGRKMLASSAATMTNVEEPLFAISCCENFCGCNGFLRATWQCDHPLGPDTRMHRHSVGQLGDELHSKDNGQAVYSNDKDEGVDCSDEVDDEVGDFNIYNRRIYTIYPASLVSSSIHSQ